jgi:protein gp37
MAETTSIEWCDSTLNLQMGCDGCELWNPAAGVRHCYAGTLTERYAGAKGWPASFDKPALFPERINAALKWPDLTGKARPRKPWLDGRPRTIFLDDMGDTFTESLGTDWLAALLPHMADSPHVWMLLTKRARRMRDFSEDHGFPPNVWPGVSITTQATYGRVRDLLHVRGGGVKWVSAEPLIGPVEFDPTHLELCCRTCLLPNVRGGTDCSACGGRMTAVELVIVGGESGAGARPMNLEWARSLVRQCRAAGVACFFKQAGSNQVGEYEVGDVPPMDRLVPLKLRDRKGGDLSELPQDLRVRQWPAAR